MSYIQDLRERMRPYGIQWNVSSQLNADEMEIILRLLDRVTLQ